MIVLISYELKHASSRSSELIRIDMQFVGSLLCCLCNIPADGVIFVLSVVVLSASNRSCTLPLKLYKCTIRTAITHICVHHLTCTDSCKLSTGT